MTNKHFITATLIFATLLITVVRTTVSAQTPWVVPEENKEEVCPFKFTPETIKAGAEVFTKNCQSCHGIPTKANWANIQPVPGDPASEKFRAETDGSLFFKISNGRGPMPQFKNILSEEQRWDVISYIRSFHAGYIQPNPELAIAAAKGGRSKIEVKFDSVSKKITFFVTNTREKITSPAGHAGLQIFVKRYFGNQPVGSVKTNDRGFASFDFPQNIPGTDSGYVTLYVALNEDGGYGNADATIRLPVGTPTTWVSLTAKNAMWNVRAKSPVWLTLAYCLTVLGVFVTLGIIAFRIKKIYEIGKLTETNQQEEI
jgi:hypothetical protein